MSRLLQRARLTSVPCDWTGARPLFTRAPFMSCQSVASAADWFQPLATPGPQASMAADRSSEAKARSRALARRVWAWAGRRSTSASSNTARAGGGPDRHRTDGLCAATAGKWSGPGPPDGTLEGRDLWVRPRGTARAYAIVRGVKRVT